jgi:hypothetical protein
MGRGLRDGFERGCPVADPSVNTRYWGGISIGVDCELVLRAYYASLESLLLGGWRGWYFAIVARLRSRFKVRNHAGYKLGPLPL